MKDPKTFKECFKESLVLFGLLDLMIIFLTWFLSRTDPDQDKKKN